jgi:putative SOS response-associated peptidase YedK
MCNLYSIDIGQQAIRDIAKAMRDVTGNMPSLPVVFPDYFAPIVRNAPDRVRELTMARWGMPSPAFAIGGKKTDPGVTNIRNGSSGHWRRWLGVPNRCVVPFTRFAENELQPDGSRPPVWFALDQSRPLAFFAGVWTRWTVGPQGKGGRDDKRPLRVPDDGAERDRGAGPSQGDAGDSHQDGADRALDDRADRRCAGAATAAAR